MSSGAIHGEMSMSAQGQAVPVVRLR